MDTNSYPQRNIPPTASNFRDLEFQVRTPQGTYRLTPESPMSITDKDGKGVVGQLAELTIGDGGSWFQLLFTHNGQPRSENGEKKSRGQARPKPNKNEANVPFLNLGTMSHTLSLDLTDVPNAAIRLMFGCECTAPEFAQIEHVEGCIFDPTTTVSVKTLERLREAAEKLTHIEPVFHATQHDLERAQRENGRLRNLNLDLAATNSGLRSQIQNSELRRRDEVERLVMDHTAIRATETEQLKRTIDRKNRRIQNLIDENTQLRTELQAEQEKKRTYHLGAGTIVFNAAPEQPYSRAAVEHEGNDLIIRVQKGMTS